jgi:hypothetical protein
MLTQSHTLCLEGLASDGVKKDALSAVGLDLLDGRGSESVGLDSQALPKQMRRVRKMRNKNRKVLP